MKGNCSDQYIPLRKVNNYLNERQLPHPQSSGMKRRLSPLQSDEEPGVVFKRALRRETSAIHSPTE